MAKSKLESKIEKEIQIIRAEADRLYHERIRLLGQLEVLDKILKP